MNNYIKTINFVYAEFYKEASVVAAALPKGAALLRHLTSCSRLTAYLHHQQL